MANLSVSLLPVELVECVRILTRQYGNNHLWDVIHALCINNLLYSSINKDAPPNLSSLL